MRGCLRGHFSGPLSRLVDCVENEEDAASTSFFIYFRYLQSILHTLNHFLGKSLAAPRRHPAPNRGQTFPQEHRFGGTNGVTKSVRLKISPPSHREHICPSPTDILSDYGGDNQLASPASAKRIETFVAERTQHSNVSMATCSRRLDSTGYLDIKIGCPRTGHQRASQSALHDDPRARFSDS